MQLFLNKFGNFSEREAEAFSSIGQRKTVDAKTILFSAGNVFNKLFFINSGVVRGYRIIDGEDYTYVFFSTNDFAPDYQSYLTDLSSSLFFETLTKTEYTVYHKKDILNLYDTFPAFERMGRILAEAAYLSAADRLKQHQTDDLKTRYLKLVSKNPELFQKVAQHYIASYLGVKPQSLSRIRAEISSRQK